MSVKTTHHEYDEYNGKWKRCRDVAKGQDAVHAAGTEYLPRLKDQTDEDYKAYRTRTPFFNATWRTISGLTGMLFRKPAKIEVPAVTEPMLATVTDDGQPIGVFANEVVEECLKVGRVGILVDYPVVKEESVTKADAAVLNLRPTMGLYLAESIINWKISVVNNLRVLTRVVLTEMIEVEITEFECEMQERYRVLDLVDGFYRVRVFKVEKDVETVLEEYIPTMNSLPMPFIPFYFLSADDTQVCPDDPPLIDLVDLNLSHYRTSADYEHGCHFTGLPTGYITGHTLGEGDKIYLGSQTMMVFPNPETQVGFLEFTGSGLGMLQTNLERKESQMAILGARMLEAQKRAAEAAETAGIHRSGENSLLASMAKSISLGMTAALQTFSNWAGGSEVVTYELNRDFFPMPLDAQAMAALVSAWQQGGISKETLFENLKQGQVIGDTVDFETEEVRIQNQLR